MAEHNASCTSIADLITQLDTYLATIGWTAEHLDTSTTAGTGGEWAMRRGNLRFACSWDAANSGTMLAIYQYSDQNYVIGDRPWGQDHDSGNGFAGSTPDSSIDNERHVELTATPEEFWVFSNESGDNYAHIVVETATGEYAHFGIGTLDKRGDWTGGEYCYGQKNNDSGFTSGLINLDNVSFLLDGHLNDSSESGGATNGSELWAATIHAEGLPNQTANGMWAVSVGGNTSVQTDFGNDRQSNDGSSSDTARVMFFGGLRNGPWANGFARGTGADIGGEMRMWPIGVQYYDSTTGDTYGPMGFMPNVFGCVIPDAVVPGTIFTDESGDTYYVFPAHKLYVSPATGSSGNLGIAYKVSVYSDPGMPASVSGDVVGWWSSYSSDDYTLTSGEVTQLNDKSGNANHFTVPATFTGPGIVTIGGRSWLGFTSGSNFLLYNASNTDIDPGTGDYSVAVVFKSTNVSATFGGSILGKVGAGNHNIIFNVGRTNDRSMYFNHRDAGVGNTDNVEHDNASFDYTDDTARMGLMTFDQTGNNMNLYGEDWSTATDTDAATNSTDIVPTDPIYIGDQDEAGNRQFKGEIAEIVWCNSELDATQRADLETYLKTKWGIA